MDYIKGSSNYSYIKTCLTHFKGETKCSIWVNTTIRSYEMRVSATSILNSRDSSSWSSSIVELLQRCTENSVMGLIYLMQELLGAVSKASSVESIHFTKSTETFSDACPCWPPCDLWGQINVYEILAVLRLMTVWICKLSYCSSEPVLLPVIWHHIYYIDFYFLLWKGIHNKNKVISHWSIIIWVF